MVVYDQIPKSSSIFSRRPSSADTFYMNDIERQKREFLMHKGTPHDGAIPHSGRNPWGSGDHPYQHEDWFRGFGDNSTYYYRKYNGKFNDCINDLQKQGMKKKEIADMLGITVKELDARVTLSAGQFRTYLRAETLNLLNTEPKMTNQQIADIFGVTEGTIRKIAKDNENGLEYRNKTLALAEELKQRVAEKGYVDVSSGNSYWINQTESCLNSAAAILKEEGYALEDMKVKQVFGDNYTSMLVLAAPGTTKSEIGKNLDKVVPVFDPEINTESTLMGLSHPPVSVDSSRIHVIYDEEGGSDRDGFIGIRRGVPDLDLGKSHDAQVRIAVDGTHYIKGVAGYKDDDIPPGKDIVIYSNKSLGTPLTNPDPNGKCVLKPMKRDENGNVDMENPFGAMIKSEEQGGQSFYTAPDGTQKLSAINKVNEEGDWEGWAGRKYLAAQMLSKQPVAIAVKQLDLAVDKRSSEFDNIMSVPNPTVRKKMLEDFANSCDTAAVDLEAAAFPRQQSHVLMPLPNIPDNQVYAPNYRDGEHVILIRFPHESTKQIPYLQVNNKIPEGDQVITKRNRDAIGISPATATQLSGADFDGDTVLVIPADGINFVHDKPFAGLVNYDAKKEYPYREGMKVMTKQQRNLKMGIITNLITDMTAQGCRDEEQLTRAIKHAQCVIDAEKHKLDWEKSYADNRIAELHKEWQGKSTGGAKTLISRAGGEADIPERREGAKILDPVTGKEVFRKIDPVTGEKLYTNTGKVREAYTDKSGKYHPAKLVTQKVTKMEKALTTGAHDARSISSGTPMEEVYARYANQCHSLGNKARLAYLGVKDDSKVNPSASKAYNKEVTELSDMVKEAKRHAPLERQAQILAGSMIRTYEKNHPGIRQTDPDKYKKVKTQYLTGARNRFGGGRKKIDISERQWEAIDSGAVSKTLLNDLMRYSDSGSFKQHYLTNNTRVAVNDAMIARVRRYSSGNYTNADIAEALGISSSTVSKILAGEIS